MAETNKEGKEEKKEEVPAEAPQTGEPPPPPPPPKIRVSQEFIAQGLSQLGKTADGSSCAYTKLVVEVI